MDKAALADIWRFPWPIMDVLIGGKSSIDLPELRVHDQAEAAEFLRGYGFDIADRDDLQQMHSIMIEAIAFIEKNLMAPGEWQGGIRPPDEILLCTDPCELMLMASSKSPFERLTRAWACAVLRVCHTILHIEGVHRFSHIPIAREQIMGRLSRHIHRDDNRDLWLGHGDERVQLERVEWKDAKSRNSIILKLLHKRDNVAESIYDFIGVRIVTKRLCDVMLVVKFLWKFDIVTYPNCYPSRARNTLVDTERFHAQIETIRDLLISGAIAPEEFDAMVARMTVAEHAKTENPFSADTYRAIQLTGRELIKLRNVQFEWLEKLKTGLDTDCLPRETRQALTELQYMIDGWYAVRANRHSSTFFPFEVQIMDVESFQQARSGKASHDSYKQSQIRAARERVLGKVLSLSSTGA